jgi:hypothetical protein
MKRPCLIFALLAIAILLSGSTLSAQRRGGGNYRSTAQTNVNRNTNINRNTNVNVNRNVNVNVNNNYYHGGGYYGGGYYGGGGCCYHPVAVAAAVTATAVVTAAVVGSIVSSVPPSCSTVIVNGLTYQQCGSTWYQPQFSGTTTTYVVVNAPR